MISLILPPRVEQTITSRENTFNSFLVSKEDLNTIQMKLNRDEVADVFTCSIEQFCCPQNQGYTQFRSGYTMPVFFWSHATPQPKIWGLTAIITHQVLSVLVPEHYKLKLHFVAKVKSQT